MLEPLFQRTFPGTTVYYDSASPTPDLIVRSHFLPREPARPENQEVPYIVWSGESYPVPLRPALAPLFEINTAHMGRDNEIWIPHIIAEIPRTARTTPIPDATQKRWCAAYAFSHRVIERERLFWSMRIKEPTCYGFGASCRTRDNPFEMPMAKRGENGRGFRDFGFVVGMENKVAPGYLTEKIGYAFMADAVPIYWGDRATVEDFFNPTAFLNVLDFPTPDAAGEYAVQVWKDPQKLQRYLDAPITLNRRLADYEAVRTEYRPWQKPIVDRLREAFPDLS